MRAFAGNTYDDYYEAPMSEFPLPSKIFFVFVACLVGAFTKIVWPWKFENGHKMWDDKSARVIVGNHVSMLEPVVTLVSLWAHGITCRPVYKSEFDSFPCAKWFLSRIGCIPVSRGHADIKCLRRCERALKRGECVLIYPEGTRIRTDDQEVEIHGGFALMARSGKAPVLPTAVVGARDITIDDAPIPLKRIFWRSFFKVGDPLRLEDMEADTRKGQCEQLEKVTMERVYELRDELRAEHPKKH